MSQGYVIHLPPLYPQIRAAPLPITEREIELINQEVREQQRRRNEEQRRRAAEAARPQTRQVSASAREEVNEQDCVTRPLVLTPIIPAEEQREIMREKLKERGWQEQEDGGLTRQRGKVAERIDLEAMHVETTVDMTEAIEHHASQAVTARTDQIDEAHVQAAQQLAESVQVTEKEKAAARAEMVRQITEAIEETEEARTRELNEVAQEVYSESLKRKARTLGTVTEIQESQDGDDYQLTIKIKEGG